MNTATLIGNLTDAVDLRYSPDGTAVAKVAVAVSRRVRRNGEWVDQLDGYFTVTAFAELGEHAADSLSKGDRVLITGRLTQRNYENREGTRRTSIEVIAEDIAPALRFATADVVKNPRGDDS